MDQEVGRDSLDRRIKAKDEEEKKAEKKRKAAETAKKKDPPTGAGGTRAPRKGATKPPKENERKKKDGTDMDVIEVSDGEGMEVEAPGDPGSAGPDRAALRKLLQGTKARTAGRRGLGWWTSARKY